MHIKNSKFKLPDGKFMQIDKDRFYPNRLHGGGE